MRTLTIAKNSHFMRFFLWAWKVDSSKLNICKLFWGTLFFPIGLLRSASAKIAAGFNFVMAVWNLLTSIHAMVVGHFHLINGIALGLVPFSVAAGIFILWIGRKTEEEKLGMATYNGNSFERLFIHSAEFVEDVIYSMKSTRLVGWFSVAGQYIRGVKERTCLNVRVV